MNIKKLCAFAAILFLTGITTVKAQNGDDIIQKHIDAVGGSDNWGKVNTMKLSGAMNVQGMDISMTQTVVNDKGMRMDISAMGINGYTIITPTEGWIYMPFQGMDKVTPLPADELQSSKEKMDVKNIQLVDKSKIAKCEYMGNDTINNAGCYKVMVTDKQGNSQIAFFDATNYYLVRTVNKIKMQNEEQELAVNFSNFQKLPEGITVPMTWGTEQGDINFKSIEINKPYSDSLFKPDVEVKK